MTLHWTALLRQLTIWTGALALACCLAAPADASSLAVRIDAPNARSVTLVADWPGGVVPHTDIAMTRDAGGKWTATVDRIPDGIWTYTILVDGVPTLDPGNAKTLQEGGRTRNYVLGDGPQSRLFAINNTPHGNMVALWYPSPALRMQRRLVAYLPPDYFTGNRRYRVLYLLHGGGMDENSWSQTGRVAQILDNLIAQRTIEPMIVVMPNGTPSQQAGSAIMDGPPSLPSNPDFSFVDSVATDLVSYIDRTFRTRTTCEDRAIAGLSMGGVQSFYIAFNHPELFCWLGTFSAGYLGLPGLAVPDAGTPPVGARLEPAPPPVTVDTEKLARLAQDFAPARHHPFRLYYLSTGANDFLLGWHYRVTAMLDRRGIGYCLSETPGYTHEMRYWRVALTDFVQRIFDNPRLPGAAPTACQPHRAP